jgi:predicted nucleotidyltransferase
MRDLQSISLDGGEKWAVEDAVSILRDRFELEGAILYGSKARGDDDAHSDVDLLLITRRLLHWREEKAIVELLFEVGMRHGVIFSPLFVSSEEWNGGRFTEFPIYKEIIRDGAMVA